MLGIRKAEKEDIPLILGFIKALAEYEKLLEEVEATENLLSESLFGNNPNAKVIIAEWDGQPAGFAVYFTNFSTFVGRKGMYLEDLFVKPEYRGCGIGKQLLIYLAKVALDEQYGRLEWAVLDWNEPSIHFYKSLGAEPMNEWTVYRLNREKITKLALM